MVCRTLDLPGLYHLFDVLFNFSTRQHHLMPAASAPDLEIHADAQHFKALRTAGVLFAGEDGISNCDIHEQLSLLPVPSGTGPYRGPRRFILSFFPSLLPCSLPGSLLVLSLSAAVSDGVLAAASGGGASVEPGIGASDDPFVRVGIGFVRAMPHTLHLHSITPSRVSVGCTTTVPASQLWSVLELPRRSVAPHCEHSRVWMPSSIQVAFVVVNHAPNLCPVLEIPRLSVAPQV